MGLGQVDEDPSSGAPGGSLSKSPEKDQLAEKKESSQPPSKRLRGPPPFAAATNVSPAVLKARAKKREKEPVKVQVERENSQVDPEILQEEAKSREADSARPPSASRERSQAVEGTRLETPNPAIDPSLEVATLAVAESEFPSAISPAQAPEPTQQDELQMQESLLQDVARVQQSSRSHDMSPGPAHSHSPGPPSARAYLSQEERKANHIASEQKRRNHIRLGYAELVALQASDVNDAWPAASDLLNETRNSTGSVTLLGRPSGKAKAGMAGAEGLGKSKSAVLLRAVSLCKWLEQGNSWFEAEIARLRSGGHEATVEDRDVMASLAALGP